MLFSTCSEIGGLSVNASEEQLAHLRLFGEYLGICFQIKDDIFDYQPDIQIGKPTGNDIRDGKVTPTMIVNMIRVDVTDIENEKSLSLKNSRYELNKEINELDKKIREGNKEIQKIMDNQSLVKDAIVEEILMSSEEGKALLSRFEISTFKQKLIA